MTEASAHSDHRPQDIRFARQQSRMMAALAWEHRGPIIKTWGKDVFAAAVLLIGSGLVLPALEFFVRLMGWAR